jgi:hypothetical protein
MAANANQRVQANRNSTVEEIDKQIAALKAERGGAANANPYYQVGAKGLNDDGRAAAIGTGAATGAAAGSVVPGVGTVIGGIVGAGTAAFTSAVQNYNAAKKNARGGPMTAKEYDSFASGPYKQKIDKIGEKFPGGKIANKVGPLGLADKVNQSVFGTTKNADQVYRDRVRKDLQKSEFLDRDNKNDYTFTFADGSTFDFGKDGNAKLVNSDGKGERKYREIDFSNSLAQTGLNATNGLAHLVTAGVDWKKGTNIDYAGYFTNAVTEGAKDEATIKARAKELYTRAGFDTIEKADAAFDAMAKAERISSKTAEVFKQQAREAGLTSAVVEEEPQQRQTEFYIPEDKPMSKKRLNSRFDTGFTAKPKANDVSTGVNQYLSMIDQMAKRRE